MLQVKNVEKYYGGKNNVTKALDRVSFDVEDGEFIAIMGASGSGKTTLLNCISTIDTVSAGCILLDGKDITELPSRELAKFRRERLGFVFQDFNLLDTLTIEENIGLTLALNHYNAAAVLDKVKETAGKLGISDILDKFPYQMNQSMGATIIMVTHDAYSASYAKRVVFLKDGRIFNELLRGGRVRSVFYHEILAVLAALGGDVSDVI